MYAPSETLKNDVLKCIKEYDDSLSEVMLNGADESALKSISKKLANDLLQLASSDIYKFNNVETYETRVIEDICDIIKK